MTSSSLRVSYVIQTILTAQLKLITILCLPEGLIVSSEQGAVIFPEQRHPVQLSVYFPATFSEGEQIKIYIYIYIQLL